MTTLVIKNTGLIESGDLTLIGSSTKREDDSKIGMYGSGNKYALAWFLRNNIDIRIFSGLSEIKLSHELVTPRDRQVAVLTVDDKLTSITSEMGPEWTGWMVLREIISNAIDEGDYEITTAFNIQAQGIEDNTMIHIPLNNELNKVVREYDYYFAFDRKATYSNNKGSVYLKSEPSKLNLYRKGIKCYDEKEQETFLDYNLENISISESRVCDAYERSRVIKNFIFASDDIPKDVLLAAIKDDILSTAFNNKHLPIIKELIADGYTFTSRKLIKLVGQLFGGDGDKALVVSHNWWEKLKDAGLVENPFKESSVEFIETSTYDLSEVNYQLLALGMDDLGVFAGKFDYSTTVVTNSKKDQFFIKDDTKDSPQILVAKIIKLLPESYITKKLL